MKWQLRVAACWFGYGLGAWLLFIPACARQPLLLAPHSEAAAWGPQHDYAKQVAAGMDPRPAADNHQP